MISTEVMERLNSTSVLIGHNLPGDIAKLAQSMPVRREWITGEATLDSLLLARMVDENKGKGGYRLENLLGATVNVEGWKADTEEIGTDARVWGHDLRVERCRLDAWAARVLAVYYYNQLADKAELVRFTHRIASVLDRVALAGAFIDIPPLEAMIDELAASLAQSRDLLQRAANIAGLPDFSPTNDDHIRTLLFDRLAIPASRITAKSKKEAVDKFTLRSIDHPVARILLDFNRDEKLWKVNGEGLRKLTRTCGTLGSESVGWLPFNINPLGARTGRRSSSNPNSQNWPAAVRRLVRSRYPDGSVGDFDYSRLEVVLIAWLSGDDKLLEAFTVGGGYLDIAREHWGKVVKKDTPEYVATKSAVLGVNYCEQWPKFASELWHKAGVRFSADFEEHRRIARKKFELYVSQHPKLVAFQEKMKQRFRDTGEAESLTGRVRHLGRFSNPDSMNKEEFKAYLHAERQAVNFPVQSLASEVTGAALLDVEAELLRMEGLGYEEYFSILLGNQRKYLTNPPDHDIIHDIELILPINEVHDDLVFDIPANKPWAQELIIETMRCVPSLHKLCPAFKAPLAVDSHIKPRWGK